MTNTLNKFMNLSNEVDSILANVEEKIQKFEEENNVDLNSEDLSYKLKEITEHLNDNYNDQN
jgi:gas vesicle protein|tara:strand:- start:81 stop:266 length:186 start_codon:yes stop_codon:yes gene_type:complete